MSFLREVPLRSHVRGRSHAITGESLGCGSVDTARLIDRGWGGWVGGVERGFLGGGQGLQKAFYLDAAS